VIFRSHAILSSVPMLLSKQAKQSALRPISDVVLGMKLMRAIFVYESDRPGSSSAASENAD